MATATVEQVVRLALDASVHRFLAHEGGLRTGQDPEDVHQARVATRRLRSDLRTFRRFIDRDWARGLRSELEWLGTELGAVRDHEVMRDRLRMRATALPDPESEAAGRVVRRLAAETELARSALIAALASTRYADLRDAMLAATTAPRFSSSARIPARSALRAVVRRPWKQLRAAAARIGDPAVAPDEALHAVRIRAKRARYAAEAVVSVFGRDARRFAAGMAHVQEVLGDHQDAVVARQWLVKATADASPADAFAGGALAHVEWCAARDARAAFPGAWQAARRRELRAWLA